MNATRHEAPCWFKYLFVVVCVIHGEMLVASEPLGNDATEVILIGTLHEFHDQCRDYSRTDLRDLIIGVGPAAILYEMPPTIGGLPTSIDGRIDAGYRGNESIAVNQAADTLGVPAVPYDRDRRNERYQETRYFEREKYVFEKLLEWSSQGGDDSAAAAVGTVMGCLLETVQGAQMDIALHAGPMVVNSAAFDKLSKNTRCLVYELVPSLLAGVAMDTVVVDLAFFSDEWSTRNSIMADNIERIAGEYSGMRIVVLCGAEHRYILRKLLQGRAGIDVREYYEVE
ncbi:MAG: hypothetical protein DRR42_16880 [Gammaproteobacteria bacterium]|nr:MAG: hypothetical protein DRR42_16880 [Gammaproteobacteria bacterium]